MPRKALPAGFACLIAVVAVAVLLGQMSQADGSAASVDLTMRPLSPTAPQWTLFYVRIDITNTDVVSGDFLWKLYVPTETVTFLGPAIGATVYPTAHTPPYLVHWSGVLAPSQSHYITASFWAGNFPSPTWSIAPGTVITIASKLYDQANDLVLVAKETTTVTIDCCWTYLPKIIRSEE